MNKKYDEFTKLKPLEMSKTISDMTYLFNQTEVPYTHYKKILDETIEETITYSIKQELLSVYYKSIKHLFEESEELFTQSLLCIALKVKPSDLRVKDRLSLSCANDFYNQNKKTITFINPILIEKFKNADIDNFENDDSEAIDYDEKILKKIIN